MYMYIYIYIYLNTLNERLSYITPSAKSASSSIARCLDTSPSVANPGNSKIHDEMGVLCWYIYMYVYVYKNIHMSCSIARCLDTSPSVAKPGNSIYKCMYMYINIYIHTHICICMHMYVYLYIQHSTMSWNFTVSRKTIEFFILNESLNVRRNMKSIY
jgi:hypothetical protein